MKNDPREPLDAYSEGVVSSHTASDHSEKKSEANANDSQRATCPHQANDTLAPFRQHHENTVLTTDQGIPVSHTDDSLKGGQRGPTLLEDFHLREKMMRFDHERIPERVVHARGSAAHGYFKVYKSLQQYTCADFLCDPTARTPVFTRFSTVVGSRGSADTARDARGFATKFYTRQGNFDLVGNNMPVFFIQDGIKFPDFVHAVKPEPHNEMPQGASAHDTFWDFVSLVPETMHMVMWVMSDRGLPRSYRMMEGFGVHTFRLVNASGKAVMCKFHWKPVLGAHSLLWDEAQELAGRDPDFHRRDLWESIENGNFPEYELGLQIVDEKDQLAFGMDMLDPTKLLPEELVPVQIVGKLTLDRNPDNFFSETEQVAYCVSNIVPGIDFTNDPLLQARLFSYLDTQITRLGGPNFAEIPINCPYAPVHNNQQDGSGRRAIPTSRALYHPNSIDGNQPSLAPPHPGSFVHRPETLEGEKNRERSASFQDHFSQARLFLNSQSPAERTHLINACRFELAKVERLAIRERVISIFQQIDDELARAVASEIGVTVRVLQKSKSPVPQLKLKTGSEITTAPSLSLANSPKNSIRTRKIAALVDNGVRADDLDLVTAALVGAGASLEVISIALGQVESAEGRRVEVHKTVATSASVFYDAVYVPGGVESIKSLCSNPAMVGFVREAFTHAKPIGSTNEGVQLLVVSGVLPAATKSNTIHNDQGIVCGNSSNMSAFVDQWVNAIKQHRFFERESKIPSI